MKTREEIINDLMKAPELTNEFRAVGAHHGYDWEQQLCKAVRAALANAFQSGEAYAQPVDYTRTELGIPQPLHEGEQPTHRWCPTCETYFKLI